MYDTKDHNLSEKKKVAEEHIYIYIYTQNFTHIKSKTSKLKLYVLGMHEW